MPACVPCLIKWARRMLRSGTLRWDQIKPHVRHELTRHGYRPVEDIKAGDAVRSARSVRVAGKQAEE